MRAPIMMLGAVSVLRCSVVEASSATLCGRTGQRRVARGAARRARGLGGAHGVAAWRVRHGPVLRVCVRASGAERGGAQQGGACQRKRQSTCVDRLGGARSGATAGGAAVQWQARVRACVRARVATSWLGGRARVPRRGQRRCSGARCAGQERRARGAWRGGPVGAATRCVGVAERGGVRRAAESREEEEREGRRREKEKREGKQNGKEKKEKEGREGEKKREMGRDSRRRPRPVAHARRSRATCGTRAKREIGQRKI